MFDTMTMTKILGAACGSLLVFLLGGWAADLIYHGGGGHGDEHQQAYVIEVEGGEAEAEEVVEEVDFAAVMADADAEKGSKVFSKCKACHKLEDGANGTGPHLYGVVGRDIAAVGDFGYSDVLSGKGGAWTPEELQAFLENPKAYAPGTKMSFAGLKKIDDRANLIAYLETIGG
ncbi:c-type cytochrome [Litoreibacter janthinus]|uniref:Cytochrome c n=1 Tax=Litoreibacter janthinus TaxID=670154 RepID=A0A1I6G427_9RHOB|nr:cytochrome c family protein [Litoreibacter janthinus]SFR36954.1 cytochrome c [Litoreibacter janthinus]